MQAARVVQRNVRGHQARVEVEELRRRRALLAIQQERAAVEVQRHARGMAARKHVKEAREAARQAAEVKVVAYNNNMVRASKPWGGLGRGRGARGGGRRHPPPRTCVLRLARRDGRGWELTGLLGLPWPTTRDEP